jgi:hypothetical protein
MPLASSNSPILGEQGGSQIVTFQQMPKVQQGRGVRHPLPAQVDAAELAKHGDIVEGVFAGFVGQIEPVGDAVHPQHAFQPHRRPAIPGLRVMRFDHGAELGPRHQRSMRARNSALRVARLCFSNPRVAASVICFIVLSLVINTLCLTQ